MYIRDQGESGVSIRLRHTLIVVVLTAALIALASSVRRDSPRGSSVSAVGASGGAKALVLPPRASLTPAAALDVSRLNRDELNAKDGALRAELLATAAE